MKAIFQTILCNRKTDKNCGTQELVCSPVLAEQAFPKSQAGKGQQWGEPQIKPSSTKQFVYIKRHNTTYKSGYWNIYISSRANCPQLKTMNVDSIR